MTKPLITSNQLNQLPLLNKLGSLRINNWLMNLLSLSKANQVYQKCYPNNTVTFCQQVLNEAGIKLACSEGHLLNIPATGPFILVANHPMGLVDGLALFALVKKIRPDFKLAGNFLLKNIEAISDSIICVDPFAQKGKSATNIHAVKEMLQHLQTSPLGIFPAGEVSAFTFKTKKITDKDWPEALGKIILKLNIKVIPVHISGHNSLWFQILGIIHPILRTMLIPAELFNKNKTVTISIGKAITPVSFANLTPNHIVKYCRDKVYNLQKVSTSGSKQKLIIAPTPAHLIEHELATVSEHKVITSGCFQVYLVKAQRIPNILREISRLREITFREAGEGTNNWCDTDEFDLYYKHLFLWDQEKKQIVGAYRIGFGNELFERFNKSGFYLNTLFEINNELIPVLQNSIELGRSFIIQSYQRKPLPLLLLWRGINMVMENSDQKYRYLIGPVSISSKFSKLSKTLMVSFLNTHYSSHWQHCIKPRTEFKIKDNKKINLLVNSFEGNISQLDNYITSIEKNELRMPVLVKKYLSMNGRLLGFNSDPNFNNSIDGLICVDFRNTLPGSLKL